MTSGELAFNGLCKGHQQRSWQKNFRESNVGSLKPWVDSGILVLEEDLVISEKEDQDIPKINKKVKTKVKTKEKEKKETWKGIQEQEEIGKGKMGKSSDGDSSVEPKKKKKETEEEADESEVVPGKMHMKEILGPSTSHDIPPLPASSETAVKGAHDEVSYIEEQDQSDSELETEQHITKKKTGRRAAGQVPLTVKFLHKVIQEWFAATFFCSMMRRYTSADQFQNYVSSKLQHINPTDLHYVLRFSSYLHPPSCHVIINYLLRSYRKDKCVPPYIMNCVFLCFNEHNDIKGPDMRNVVTDLCKEVITIQSEDSRLLQQAKSALLEYASNDGLIIEKLDLIDVIIAVDKTSLTLNSGIQLRILHTVKVIEVSRWDQVLQEEDYTNILKLLSAGKLLKEMCCIFPSQPPKSLDEITLRNIVSKNLKVEWHIGHFVQSLDPIKGKWMINFRKPGTYTTEIKEVNTNQAKSEEEMQGPTTSSLPGTSAKSSKDVHTQGTMKRIGSDSICEVVVPEKKAKVFTEEPSASDITLQAGTVLSGEQEGVLEEIPVRSVVERNFQEEAVATGVERRTLPEEISVTTVGQWYDQGQILNVDIDERFNLQRMPMGGVRQIGFQEADSFNRTSPVFFSRETLNDVTLHAGTVRSGEQEGVLEEIPVRSVIERNFQEEAVATGVERRTLPEEISVTSVAQWYDQGQIRNDDIDERFNLQRMPMGGVRQIFFQEADSFNRIFPLFFLRETFSDVTQQSVYGDTSVQRAVQQNSPIFGCAQSQLIVQEDQIQMFQSQAVITQFGGVIEIPDTGVILRVPQDALPEDMDTCLIQMRIIPASMSHDETMSFSSNSSVRVELLPNHFRFRCHAHLTLPHCLELKKNVPRKARIFMSHHNEGEMPQWEEQLEQFYELLDTSIVIGLKSFCWIKCEIDDELVDAKRLKIYTAARKMYLTDKFAVVEVGYHLDMPGEQEILKMNRDLILADRKPFVFVREGKQSLFIHLTRIVPHQWKCYDQSPKEIPFQTIAESLEKTCPFLVAKETPDRDIPICFFTASQRYRTVERTVEVTIRPEVHLVATPWDVRCECGNKWST